MCSTVELPDPDLRFPDTIFVSLMVSNCTCERSFSKINLEQI